MHSNDQQHRALLQSIAHRAMIERGLLPDFSAAALAELDKIQAAAGATNAESIRDLTDLLWASIDNDDSRDLDQLTVAETLPGGNVKIRVAVADVDALVKDGSAIDEHARHNTTSVYTAAEIFPMLPEALSTDLTSLNFAEERLAVVVEMVVGADGALLGSDIYRARVRNHAKLAYHSVAAWLEGNGALPDGIAAVKGLAENLRVQDRIAQSLKNLRHVHGALSLETIEAKPVFDGDRIRDLEVDEKNRAKELIEDFMIAANGVTARYLAAKKFPSIRRVVRTPKRWDRIVELAREQGAKLPDTPDSAALDKFLVTERAADPQGFPDLSLAVIKLLGAGEYVAERPGDTAPGHFGLAVKDYAHSTAPNRRYPDLITQRLLKAAIAGRAAPYSYAELDVLAKHFTAEEDAANKVERQVSKSAAALLLESRIGEQFNAIATGASDKGTWVRLLTVPVEGKVMSGFEGVDVGDRIRVQLVDVDVERGFIDFRKVGSSRR
ncbi:MAG: RNB domain-containing ribonuclease [Anaerolineae bacterium]|uniref:RNB domain-containing ribonuclease n=1 Tax=Candidatus Amarolinea dominans TaxID=3140696 RepID=UPI003136307E|nr:RNB domain-containing ribonuclease [Anaerolineae bacterium]MBK9231135.1 RNB domain-containing ribonuclease [Anaerolineae bacterium]